MEVISLNLRLRALRFCATMLWLFAQLLPLKAEDDTLLVIDGAGSNIVGALAIGIAGTNNGLLVTNGGRLTNGAVVVGMGSNAAGNFATVVGSNSTWRINGGLTVGSNGAFNRLTISDGAGVTNSLGVIGWSAGANSNTVSVTGANSLWKNTSSLAVGSNGAFNQLLISNGGTVSDSAALIGGGVGGDWNFVSVIGASSFWSNTGGLTVGSNGAFNRLLISNSGAVVAGSLIIGSTNAGSNNVVNVVGAGSLLSVAGTMTVGRATTSNQLTIGDGAIVRSGSNVIGQGTNSWRNSVLIMGGGSVLSNSAGLAVGLDGAFNLLTISNGGVVYSLIGTVGGGTTLRGSNNAATITGAGSSWLLSTSMVIGVGAANNQLTISSGGLVSDFNGIIGASNTATSNAVTVSDAGTQWENFGDLVVGNAGSGNLLTIAAGAYVSNVNGTIGATNSGDTNTVFVTDTDTLWLNSGVVTVGGRGSFNQLVVSNGAQVMGASMIIGGTTNSNNVVTVTGSGSEVNLNGSLLIGSSGSKNQLRIMAGGRVSGSSLILGNSPGAFNNQALIDGTNSSLEITGLLTLGNGGLANKLVITNYGRLTSAGAIIGGDYSDFLHSPPFYSYGFANSVVVGGGARWDSGDTIVVGKTNALGLAGYPVSNGGQNQLIIAPGGTVSMPGLVLGGIEGTASSQTGSNSIQVTGGRLIVTNAAGNGTLLVNSTGGGKSFVSVSAGSVEVDRLDTLQFGAVIKIADTLFVGGTNALDSGQMRIGRELGEWTNRTDMTNSNLIIGSDENTTGRVTIAMAATWATNAGNGKVIVGDRGAGVLFLTNNFRSNEFVFPVSSFVITDQMLVGNGPTGQGSVSLTGTNAQIRLNSFLSIGSNAMTQGHGTVSLVNGAILETTAIFGPTDATGGLTNFGSVLQFTTNAPQITGTNLVSIDGIISFRSITNAFVSLADAGEITNLQLLGNTKLQLSSASTAPATLLELKANVPGSYAGLIGTGSSTLNVSNLSVASDAYVAVTNGTLVVTGGLTNQGEISISSGTLMMQSPVIFQAGTTLTGRGGTQQFRAGLLVQSNDLIVPSNFTFQANAYLLDQGTITNFGAFEFTNLTPSLPLIGLTLNGGIISYRSLTNAPVNRDGVLTNINFIGDTTLRLNSATNAFIDNYLFQSASNGTGYAQLQFSSSSLWQGGSLTIGTGGILSNGSGSIINLTNGLFVVTNGGKAFNPRFPSAVSNHTWMVSGIGSVWKESGNLKVGDTGSGNSLLVTGGGTLTSGGGFIGNNSDGNRMLIAGSNSSWQAATLSGVEIGYNGNSNTLQIIGGGALYANSFDVGYNGSGNSLEITNGGNLFGLAGLLSTIGFYSSASNNWIDVSGVGSTMMLGANLHVGRDGSGNRYSVSNGATVQASGTIYIGANSVSSNNLMLLSGTNTAMNVNELLVGYAGSGNSAFVRDAANLVVTNHLTVTSGFSGTGRNQMGITSGSKVSVGGHLTVANYDSAGFGNLNIDGAGTEVLVASNLNLRGYYSVLSITGGARLTNDATIIGSPFGYTNLSIVVSGYGTEWRTRSILFDLDGGHALQVQKGAQVFTGRIEPSSSLNGGSTVTINGGALYVTNGTASGLLNLGTSGVYSNIQLNLLKGSLTVDNLQHGFEGGSVVPGPLFNFTGGKLSVRSFASITPTLQIGAGTWVAHMKLLGGVATNNGNWNLAAHSWLTGTGTFKTPSVSSFTSSGEINPGDSFGTLVFGERLQLSSLARMTFDIGGTQTDTEYDAVQVQALASLSGSLNLKLAAGYLPANTDVFNLMTFTSRSGNFTNALPGARLNTADNLGSFLVSYSSTNLTVSGYQSTDLDGDRVEDAWAMKYFGFSPLLNGAGPTDKFGDFDGDGQSNYAEFVAGTDPTDSKDFFGITSMNLDASGNTVVQFRFLPGKTARIFFSDDMVAWTEVASPDLRFPSNSVCEWVDDGGQTGSAALGNVATVRFYRISME